MIDTLIGAAVEVAAPADRTPRPSRAQVSRMVGAAAVLPPRWRPFASCVIRRESHGNPQARNPHSSAAGKYQFLDTGWRSGLAYMVAHRLKEHGVPKREARRIRVDLQSRNIATWPERYQDVGFAEVISRGGWRHWTGGHGCNGLVP